MSNNRIDKVFEKKRAEGEKVLIPFFTAGDPDLETTRALMLDVAKRGADLIELGVPFSDPMAEGPIVQEANERALAGGTHIDDIMLMVEELRKEIDTPLVYLLYFNTILSYGVDRFFARCKEAGVDGLIIPDLPFEESDEITAYTEKYQVYQIMMVSPTSSERMAKIGKVAKGFLYCVLPLDATDMQSGFSTKFEGFFGEVRKYCDLPCCVSFGISTPEQVREVKPYCDGVIVGSAIVERIAEAKGKEDCLVSVGDFVESLKETIDS